jgi:hypothetical protein
MFRCLTVELGGPTTLFNFPLSRTFVRPSALQALEKQITYVPLSEVSQRLSARSYFTIACICDMEGDLFLISDQSSTKRFLDAAGHPILNKFDVVAIANAQVTNRLTTRTAKQIRRIGSCDPGLGERPDIITPKPLPELPPDFVTRYLESHAMGRAAKFMRALKCEKCPTVGTGFSVGEEIPL